MDVGYGSQYASDAGGYIRVRVFFEHGKLFLLCDEILMRQ
jgi:hypothetical protein